MSSFPLSASSTSPPPPSASLPASQHVFPRVVQLVARVMDLLRILNEEHVEGDKDGKTATQLDNVQHMIQKATGLASESRVEERAAVDSTLADAARGYAAACDALAAGRKSTIQPTSPSRSRSSRRLSRADATDCTADVASGSDDVNDREQYAAAVETRAGQQLASSPANPTQDRPSKTHQDRLPRRLFDPKVPIMVPESVANRQKIVEMVRIHGGVLSSRIERAGIVVVDEDTATRGLPSALQAAIKGSRLPPLVSPAWVEACVAEQATLDAHQDRFILRISVPNEATIQQPNPNRAKKTSLGSAIRVPYTQRDRENIIEFLAITSLPWNGFECARELEARYGRHSGQSYQTFIRHNLDKSFCLRNRVEACRRQLPAGVLDTLGRNFQQVHSSAGSEAISAAGEVVAVLGRQSDMSLEQHTADSCPVGGASLPLARRSEQVSVQNEPPTVRPMDIEVLRTSGLADSIDSVLENIHASSAIESSLLDGRPEMTFGVSREQSDGVSLIVALPEQPPQHSFELRERRSGSTEGMLVAAPRVEVLTKEESIELAQKLAEWITNVQTLADEIAEDLSQPPRFSDSIDVPSTIFHELGRASQRGASAIDFKWHYETNKAKYHALAEALIRSNPSQFVSQPKSPDSSAQDQVFRQGTVSPFVSKGVQANLIAIPLRTDLFEAVASHEEDAADSRSADSKVSHGAQTTDTQADVEIEDRVTKEVGDTSRLRMLSPPANSQSPEVTSWSRNLDTHPPSSGGAIRTEDDEFDCSFDDPEHASNQTTELSGRLLEQGTASAHVSRHQTDDNLQAAFRDAAIEGEITSPSNIEVSSPEDQEVRAQYAPSSSPMSSPSNEPMSLEDSRRPSEGTHAITLVESSQGGTDEGGDERDAAVSTTLVSQDASMQSEPVALSAFTLASLDTLPTAGQRKVPIQERTKASPKRSKQRSSHKKPRQDGEPHRRREHRQAYAGEWVDDQQIQPSPSSASPSADEHSSSQYAQMLDETLQASTRRCREGRGAVQSVDIVLPTHRSRSSSVETADRVAVASSGRGERTSDGGRDSESAPAAKRHRMSALSGGNARQHHWPVPKSQDARGANRLSSLIAARRSFPRSQETDMSEHVRRQHDTPPLTVESSGVLALPSRNSLSTLLRAQATDRTDHSPAANHSRRATNGLPRLGDEGVGKRDSAAAPAHIMAQDEMRVISLALRYDVEVRVARQFVQAAQGDLELAARFLAIPRGP